MGRFNPGERWGRPCEKRSCFLRRLDEDAQSAQKALRRRGLYTLIYVLAVLAPGAALMIYAAYHPYFAPTAAAPFVAVDSTATAEPLGLRQLAAYFTFTSHFFAMLGEELVADVPLLASVAAYLPQAPLQPNPDATLFSSLVTAFKWISGPVLLFSGLVLTEIWGGFQSMSRLIAQTRKAHAEVSQMSDNASQRAIRSKIRKVMAAQETT